MANFVDELTQCGMKQVVALLLLMTALSSCGVHIQKRLYRDGFYITRSENHPEVPKHLDSGAVEQPDDSIPLPDVKLQTAAAAITNTRETGVVPPPQLHTAEATVLPMREDSLRLPDGEPSPDTVDQQIADLHKLDVATKISLLLWLTIIGGAIGIPAAFVLSLITLIRIKRLKREHTLSEKQLAETEKVRRHARAVLWISSIMLGLAIIALIALLASPWSIGVTGPLLSF